MTSTMIGKPKLVTMDTIQPERIDWLWPGKIPSGKVSLLAGDPGLGKSLVTIDMASRVTRGIRWPDSDEPNPPGSVIILSAEDDPADTIRPRLDAARAEVAKVVLMQAIEWYDVDAKKPCTRPFNLERDIPTLDNACEQYPDVKLVIVDPVSAYCGGTDSHKNAEVRGLLAPLAEFAARRRLAVVCVTHLNKSAGPAMYRSMGSLAFVAVSRAVWGIVKDPSQPSNRLMLPVKCNLSADTTGLAYRIVETDGVPHLDWDDKPTRIRIDEVLDSDRQPKGNRSAERREAADWLRRELEDGAVAATELEERAREVGLKWRTVQHAKDDLGLQSDRKGYGPGARWFWKPPESPANEEMGINGINGHNGSNEPSIDTIDTIDANWI
jgi:putative DNA primase/helicase